MTMTCRVKAAPTAKVTWYKDSRLLRNNQDFEQTFDGTLCTLTMPEIFPDDAGEYKCVITCGDEKVETVAQLTIKGKPQHKRFIGDILGLIFFTDLYYNMQYFFSRLYFLAYITFSPRYSLCVPLKSS